MKQGLQLKLSGQLTMTPQLQQAIRLLQLSTLELQNEIATALETNPMLEVVEDGSHSLQNTLPDQANIMNASSPAQKSKADGWDHHDEAHHNRAAEETLQDHLLWQLRFAPFTEQEHMIAAVIIDAITDEGYLTLDIEGIQATLGDEHRFAQQDIADVLSHIQHFDPPGIAARSLQECLVLQIKQAKLDADQATLAIDIIENDLPLLAQHAYTDLKRRYQLTDALLLDMIKLIKSLDPKPGVHFSNSAAHYIIPDLLAFKNKNIWRVILNPDSTPNIRVNNHYASLTKQSKTPADQAFFKEHLQEARWLLKSLENRHETLLKVAEAIISRQQEFFEHGEEAMRPLVLTDIAQEVDMHESTISRITTQKYMHTPRGVFELKYFFSSHVHMQHGGECSSTAIRALIKKLVAAEDRKQPLSDNKLTDVLKSQGINIARRTVAKYRESLLIASSNERKRQYWQKVQEGV